MREVYIAIKLEALFTHLFGRSNEYGRGAFAKLIADTYGQARFADAQFHI